MDKFNRIEDKIDVIVEKLSTIDKTLERNTISLEYHVKRTNLLEKSLEEFREELVPVENHVKNVKFLGFLIAGLGSLIAVAYYIVNIYKIIN